MTPQKEILRLKKLLAQRELRELEIKEPLQRRNAVLSVALKNLVEFIKSHGFENNFTPIKEAEKIILG